MNICPLGPLRRHLLVVSRVVPQSLDRAFATATVHILLVFLQVVS